MHKQIKEFKKFLSNCGAEILTPTNIYEVLRFKANGNTGIVYQNDIGHVTKFVGEAKKAIECFTNKTPYSCNEVKNRVRKHVVLQSLLQRDGTNCFYCGKEMQDGQETIEHLFSINQGGRNHISNLALAHKECNQQASHLSVVEKVKLREKLQG